MNLEDTAIEPYTLEDLRAEGIFEIPEPTVLGDW